MANSIQSDILAAVDAAKAPVTVGFDVFDTVVTRVIPKEHSLEAMCRAIALRFFHDRERFTDVRNAYVAAYHDSATANEESGLDFEADTDVLFDDWATRLLDLEPGDPEALTRSALETCIVDVEAALLRPMPQAVELLEALKERGVRAIYVSDMYLGRKIVRQLLEAHGVADYFAAGYVSSDYGLLKRTGNLFPIVLEREGIEPENLFFLGDDYGPDVQQPSKLGIACFHFVFPALEGQRKTLRDCFAAASGDRALLPHAVLEAAAGPVFEACSVEAFSVNKYIGPYFGSFALAVAQEYRSSGHGSVLFAAREGLFLKELTDIVDRAFGAEHVPRKIYFPASRLSAFAYSLHDQPFGMIDVANLHRNGRPTLRTLVSFLKLDEKDLQALAERSGLANADTEMHGDLVNWGPIYRVIEAVNHHPRMAGQRENGALFHEWMRQQGVFDGKPKLFVDLGWSAQIQDSLARGFERRGLDVYMTGYYSGLRLEAHWRRQPRSEVRYFHCDDGEDNPLSKAPLWFPQILETLCRAPHGTVTGFSRAPSGAIDVVFAEKRSATEVADDVLISRIQRLVKTYTERLAMLCRLYELSAYDLRHVVNERVFKFLMTAEEEVARRFAGFCNVSDLGSEEVYAWRGGMGTPDFDLDRFAAIERSTLWPCGAAASYFGEQAAHAYAEEHVRIRNHNGELRRAFGLTAFNPSRPLVDLNGSFDAEMPEPGDPAAIAGWNARVSGISELGTELGETARTRELFTRLPCGSLSFTHHERTRQHDVVRAAVEKRNAHSWPPDASTRAMLGEAREVGYLRRELGFASQMAVERLDTINNMDQMIRERDQAIASKDRVIAEQAMQLQVMAELREEKDGSGEEQKGGEGR